MWFRRTRQAGKADRHYTAPCPGEKIKATQGMYAQTAFHHARESSVGVRQSSGVCRRLGMLEETRAQVLGGKKLEIFVLCHHLNRMGLFGVEEFGWSWGLLYLCGGTS